MSHHLQISDVTTKALCPTPSLPTAHCGTVKSESPTTWWENASLPTSSESLTSYPAATDPISSLRNTTPSNRNQPTIWYLPENNSKLQQLLYFKVYELFSLLSYQPFFHHISSLLLPVYDHLALPSRGRGGVTNSGECTPLTGLHSASTLAVIGPSPVPTQRIQRTWGHPTFVGYVSVRTSHIFRSQPHLDPLSSLFSGTRAHQPDNHLQRCM